MTSLRDAYPNAMPMSQNPSMPGLQGGGPQGIPHGPMGGMSAGSMDNKMPIEQIDGREPMESFLEKSRAPAYPQQQPSYPNQPHQDAATSHAASEHAIRQRMAAYQAAEAKMRGIAKEENRMQAVGYIAIGMCVVFIAIFVIQMRGAGGP